MFIRKKPARPHALGEPILHENHKRPVTRRDFVAAGLLSAPAVVMAPAIGPTLGGWITDNYSWRWIFFVNIPVGILSLLLTSRLIQDPPDFRRRKLSETKIDFVGLGFVALGLGCLQIVLDKGQRDDWFESHFITVLATVAAVVLRLL